MPFVPTACAACQQVFLASANQGTFCCPCCGSEARVVPGCTFADTDRELFAELAQVVLEGRVDACETRRLAAQVERALTSGSYAALLGTLSERLPGLTPVEASVAHSPRAQRQTLTMLHIILDAKSSLASSSSPRISPGPPRMTKHGRHDACCSAAHDDTPRQQDHLKPTQAGCAAGQ